MVWIHINVPNGLSVGFLVYNVAHNTYYKQCSLKYQESHGVVIDEVMCFLPQLRNRRWSGAFEWTARPWRCSAGCGFWPQRPVPGIRWLGQHLPYLGKPVRGWRMNQTIFPYFFSRWASNILDSDAHRYRIDSNQFLDKRVKRSCD